MRALPGPTEAVPRTGISGDPEASSMVCFESDSSLCLRAKKSGPLPARSGFETAPSFGVTPIVRILALRRYLSMNSMFKRS